MGAWLELKAWPEVPPALRELKGRGLRLAFLSDATPVMLDSLGGELGSAWRFRRSPEH